MCVSVRTVYLSIYRIERLGDVKKKQKKWIAKIHLEGYPIGQKGFLNSVGDNPDDDMKIKFSQ